MRVEVWKEGVTCDLPVRRQSTKFTSLRLKTVNKDTRVREKPADPQHVYKSFTPSSSSPSTCSSAIVTPTTNDSQPIDTSSTTPLTHTTPPQKHIPRQQTTQPPIPQRTYHGPKHLKDKPSPSQQRPHPITAVLLSLKRPPQPASSPGHGPAAAQRGQPLRDDGEYGRRRHEELHGEFWWRDEWRSERWEWEWGE